MNENLYIYFVFIYKVYYNIRYNYNNIIYLFYFNKNYFNN